MIGGVESREETVCLDFLGGRHMVFWADGETPREVVRGEATIPEDGLISIKLAPAGGFVAIVSSKDAAF